MSQELKLTPEQQVCVDYRGLKAKDLVIQGIAGSGKSTVLMYRAKKYLIDEYVPGRPNQVIIFTYNNTLVNYLQECFNIDDSKKDCVKITTLDAYLTDVFFFTRGSNRKRRIEDWLRKKYMQKALDAHKSKYGPHRLHDAGVDFWLEECQWMRDMNIAPSDLEVYQSLQRKGRGGKVKIFGPDKEVAFQIYLSYNEQMHEKYLCESGDRYLFLSHNLSNISDRFKYDHVLIDEAQDHSLTKMLIVAALSKKDVTISMDMKQRIYKQTWTLSQLGLQSITKTLKIGMRSSPQIVNFANAFIKHNEDVEIDPAPPMCPDGPLPIVKKVTSDYAVRHVLVETLKDWVSARPNAKIGVLGATNKLVEQYGGWFTDAVLMYEFIKPGERFSVNKPGIKLSTIHSAKGLEFDYVIIPGFDWDVYPWLPKTDDQESINDHIQQGRSLVYVAATRAKRQLLIICGPKPSRYVEEFGPTLYIADGFDVPPPDPAPVEHSSAPPAPPEKRTVRERDEVLASPIRNGSKPGHFHIDTKHYPAHSSIVGKAVGERFVIGGNEYVITGIISKDPTPPKVLNATPRRPSHWATPTVRTSAIPVTAPEPPRPVIDCTEVLTAKELYDKYRKYTDGPFLIVRSKWHGDYCYVIDGFYNNDTWIRGRTFVNGVFHRAANYHADWKEFRMYDGPSRDKIKAQL